MGVTLCADLYRSALHLRPGLRGRKENELIPISTVCRRVDTFTDPLPEEVFNALYFLVTQKHLKEKLDAERTYATGAQLLLRLIEDRKAEWGEVWAETWSRAPLRGGR